MPGENADYESTGPKSMSTMSIVLGSVLVVAGVPLTVFPVTMPLGATFLVAGGVVLGGGTAAKIGKKIKKSREEKKEKLQKQSTQSMRESLTRNADKQDSDSELNTVFDQPKIVDFKARKSTIKQFDVSDSKKEVFNEKTEKRHGKRK